MNQSDFVEYVAPGSGPDEPYAYLWSTDTVGDVMIFEALTGFDSPSGIEISREQITLTVSRVLRDDQYRAIGMAAVAWAHLEDRLHYSLGRFLEIDKRAGRVISSRYGRVEPLLADIEKILSDKCQKSGRDEFAELKAKISELAKKRNEYVHAVWWPTPDPTAATADLRTRVNPKALGKISVKEIEERATEMDKTNIALKQFLKKYYFLPGA